MASCLGGQGVPGPCRWWHADYGDECWSFGGEDAAERLWLEVVVCDVTFPREEWEAIPIATCGHELSNMHSDLGTCQDCGGSGCELDNDEYQILEPSMGTWIYYEARYKGGAPGPV
jgi:hypothetical protein